MGICPFLSVRDELYECIGHSCMCHRVKVIKLKSYKFYRQYCGLGGGVEIDGAQLLQDALRGDGEGIQAMAPQSEGRGKPAKATPQPNDTDTEV